MAYYKRTISLDKHLTYIWQGVDKEMAGLLQSVV